MSLKEDLEFLGKELNLEGVDQVCPLCSGYLEGGEEEACEDGCRGPELVASYDRLHESVAQIETLRAALVNVHNRVLAALELHQETVEASPIHAITSEALGQ